MSAWAYLIKYFPVNVTSLRVVVKNIYMKEDECNVEKHWEAQQSFTLTMPNYLSHTQLLSGSAVGIGICRVLNCKIGKQQHAVTVHRAQSSDRVNYVPFEEDCQELIHRGFDF
jgi:hypothetical protein